MSDYQECLVTLCDVISKDFGTEREAKSDLRHEMISSSDILHSH